MSIVAHDGLSNRLHDVIAMNVTDECGFDVLPVGTARHLTLQMVRLSLRHVPRLAAILQLPWV